MTEVQPPIPESSSSTHQDRPQEPGNIQRDQNSNGSAPKQARELTDAEREELARARTANEKALQESREGVWFFKEITFNGQKKKIVTQNYNGCV